MFRDELRKIGVFDEQLVVFNFEDPDVPEFKTWKEAWSYIKPHLGAENFTYVFLDEVQRIPEFEKLVDGLHSRKNIDVYITGSCVLQAAPTARAPRRRPSAPRCAESLQ